MGEGGQAHWRAQQPESVVMLHLRYERTSSGSKRPSLSTLPADVSANWPRFRLCIVESHDSVSDDRHQSQQDCGQAGFAVRPAGQFMCVE